LCFWERVSLCSQGWTWTGDFPVSKKDRDSKVPVFWVLRLQAHAATFGPKPQKFRRVMSEHLDFRVFRLETFTLCNLLVSGPQTAGTCLSVFGNSSSKTNSPQGRRGHQAESSALGGCLFL
jgi:hypothetical protein